jgi:hypothetical protein
VGPAFLVLSEDSSEAAVPTIKALTKKLCQVVTPGLATQHLTFEPPEARLRRALTGNKWKSRSRSDQADRIDLVRTIASQLLRRDAFVVFHFDGDVAYGSAHTAENPRHFEEQILRPLRDLLYGRLRDAGAVSAAVSKLILFVPYYCIESWTFYNARVLRLISSAPDAAKVEEWAAHPELLEEIIKPWDEISVGKTQNLRLAEDQFPTPVGLSVGKSLADTVISLVHNEALLTSLWSISNDES